MKFPVFSQLAGNSGSRDEFARDCPIQRRVGSELDSRQIMTAPAMTPFHIRRITSRLRAVSAVRRALAD
jgi:hypothetical protein